MFSFHLEPLVRVHLARFGARDDLLAAIAHADARAAELLQDARTSPASSSRIALPSRGTLGGLLFDALVAQADALRDWAARARQEVSSWPHLTSEPAARDRAVHRMQTFLATRAGGSASTADLATRPATEPIARPGGPNAASHT